VFLIEEIMIEVLMVAAVVGGIVCLAYLLQVTVRERVYLRRVERERREARTALVRWSWLDGRTQNSTPDRNGRSADAASVLREKRA
jgi:hypothetical protein